MNASAPVKLRFSIAVISAAALAYEILLMRLFSIIQWHHFGYMIISLALLGYGVSGTFLALARDRLLAWFSGVYLLNLSLFGLSAVGCYAVAQRIPFNAEEVLWDPRQIVWLSCVYFLLFLPFFFAANAIGLALSRAHHQASKIYAADLLGAGFGSLSIILVLFVVFPDTALKLIAMLGLLSVLVALWELGFSLNRWAVLCLSAGLVPLMFPDHWAAPEITPYKGLPQTLRIPGTRIVDENSSPLGLISIVESVKTPLRYAPGLSLNATGEPLPQIGVFTDAEGMSVITHYDGDRKKLEYFDQMTSALPYHLRRMTDVLILGAGAGADVLQALYHGPDRIDAVELNPQVVALVKERYADFAGRIYASQNVHVNLGEARGFVVRSTARYDLIQLALLDSFSASSAGLFALSENYVYTVEAFRDYLGHLSPGGFLAVTRWVKVPPRDALKLFATAVDALEGLGIEAPGRRIALIRGWQTSTLLVKNGDFGSDEIESLKAFCQVRSFDTAYYPGMKAGTGNRFNILQAPYFFDGATALLSEERKRFVNDYKFDVRPATDDRPFFFHFFKWRVLPEILGLRGSGGMPLLESGYLVLVATFAQATLASVVLILLPFGFLRRSTRRTSSARLRFKVLSFFLAIGLAFLFIEIAFIQKFILFLSHPLYAVTIVLGAFLVFAGLGSAWCNRFRDRSERGRALAWAVTGLALLGLFYVVSLGGLLGKFLMLPDIGRIVISILLIAPFAFLMGMPFPLAVLELGETNPSLIPWAWGINGCASVLSAVLATLLAIQFGFSVLVILALALYGVAALSFPKD
ncbi:MAG: SAM-dependent methyltransferase [Pseudomonadota bacterium]